MYMADVARRFGFVQDLGVDVAQSLVFGRSGVVLDGDGAKLLESVMPGSSGFLFAFNLLQLLRSLG
jgi:hypothetical protein